MSRVYFHSLKHETEIHGSERAHLRSLTEGLSSRVLGIVSGDSTSRWVAEQLRDIVVGPSYAPMPAPMPDADRDHRFDEWERWSRCFSTALVVGMGALFRWNGHDINTFPMQLNTALAIGGDAIKLAARIHGACEIHAWVDEHNRAWLADIAQAGVDSGIFRASRPYTGMDGTKSIHDLGWTIHDLGWTATIAHLRNVAEYPGPVVMSYSVCEQFPNRSLAGDLGSDDADDEDGDSFYDLSDEEKWARCMATLRAQDGGLELRPDNWGSFYFDNGVTFMDLLATDRDERLRRKLGEPETKAA